MIVVDPLNDGDAAEFRAYLLGMVLGAILHQRGVMVLHGSAVQTPVGTVVFVADSGVGKSTLAVAMHQVGYPLLTDDLCTVRTDDEGGLGVAPGLQRVKLEPKTAARLGLDVATGMSLGRTQKKASFPLTSALTSRRPAWSPLAAIYQLDTGSVDQPQKVRLDIQDAYQTLILNTYRREWMDRMGLQAQIFRSIAPLIERIPVYRLVRPDAGMEMDALVRRIEEDWRV